MRGSEVRGGREKEVAARRRLSDHLWKDRCDRLSKALQTVNHGNENVADAPGPQFIHDPQPEFGAFGGFDHRPRMSFVPSGVTPSATLLRTSPSSRILMLRRRRKSADTSPRAADFAIRDRLQNRVGDRRNEIGRNFQP
jgi:hypothetical protein